jgi:hypothetical protein
MAVALRQLVNCLNVINPASTSSILPQRHQSCLNVINPASASSILPQRHQSLFEVRLAIPSIIEISVRNFKIRLISEVLVNSV